MFGMNPVAHGLRYEMAEEFTTLMEWLWAADENLTFEGRFWKTENAYVAVKPVNGRPILLSAASSEAGLNYAVKHSDLIFITSPAGADLHGGMRSPVCT